MESANQSQPTPRPNALSRLAARFTGRRKNNGLADSLSQEQGRLEALVDSLADYILAVDTSGIITIANQPVHRLFAEAGSIVGQNFDALWRLSDMAGNPLQVFGKSTTLSFHRDDIVYNSANGSLNLALSVAAYPTAARKPQGFIVVIRDITKQKSLDEQKEEFIAVTSHELRTPLAIIEAALSSVKDPALGQLNEASAKLIDQAYRTTKHLSLIVGDLTTLNRADHGLLDVELSTVEPSVIIGNIFADYQAEAQAKGLELKTEISPKTHAILTSEFRVSEVVRNFTSNALKYTKQGSVTLIAEPGDNNGIRFSVRDTGIGIAVADQPKLFSRFYQAEDYRTRTADGTGLGLYICQRLAERLSGRVGFTSEVGVGSTFYLEVPPYSRLEQDLSKVTQAAAQDLAQQL